MNIKEIRNIIRKDILKMIFKANSGHPAGALGMADVFSVLYFHEMEHEPRNPYWIDRDRLVLSNGHICPVRYSAMARSGYFHPHELKTLRRLGSRLQGHPSYVDLPAVESSSGSLGQGLSIAVGMALAAKLDKKDYKVYCVMSDGELDEGSSWEAINAAHKFGLDNLIVIVDRNFIQISGETEGIWPLEPLDKKFEAHNWNVLKSSGHDFNELLEVFETANNSDKPVVIIAKTVPGKGVSFMEGRFEWHGRPPNKEELKQALLELKNGGSQK